MEEIYIVEQKILITALSKISATLNLTREKLENTTSLYSVQSLDNKINISFDFDDIHKTYFEDLKSIIKYVYNEYGFVLSEELENDIDVLIAITKLNNGIIKLRQQEEVNSYDKQPIWFAPKSEIAKRIVKGRVIISEIMYHSNNTTEMEYHSLMLVKYFLDSIINKKIYSDQFEIIDFLRMTLFINTFSDVFEKDEPFFSKLCATFFQLDEEEINN